MNTISAEIVVNINSDNYTVIKPDDADMWKLILAQLVVFSKAENILIEEITEKKYQEVMEFKSLSVNFPYSMPFNSFCKKFKFKNQTAYKKKKPLFVAYATYCIIEFLCIDYFI